MKQVRYYALSMLLASIIVPLQIFQAQEAYGHGIVDQSFTTGGVLNSISGVTGQGFTPTVNNLVAVDLFLACDFKTIDPNPEEDGDEIDVCDDPSGSLTVNIRQGAVNGPVVGTTSKSLNLPAFPSVSVEHFDFPASVPLIPGNQYFMEFQESNMEAMLDSNCNNLYAGGTFIQNGVDTTDCDALFRTYFLGGCLYVSDRQPEDPISMNTVRNNNIAKTIHAEKQIFECTLEQGDIPVIVDVTIIAEIYEDMNTQTIIKKDALTITCIKEESQATLIQCESSIPDEEIVPVRNCTEDSIEHPQEMNTVNKGSIVKTIEAQKEVFLCTLDDGTRKKVDVVLFTEIWENLGLLPNNPVVKHTFESMRCIILIDEAEVESCKFSTVQN
jgi:hypothetical protein